MQRWSPDEFAPDAGAGIPTHHGVEVLSNPDFVEDRPQEGADAFMKRLDPDERDTLYEMVAADIRNDVQTELFAEYGEHLELLRKMLVNVRAGLDKAIADELHAMALGAVELALAVGERLARASLEVDRTHLLRGLEELIGRTHVGAALTLVAHPLEIDKLQSCEAELKDLNVVALVPDRALEPGGCIVRSAGQEWDLTFRGQADALGDLVREAMRRGGDVSVDAAPPPEPDAEPGNVPAAEPAADPEADPDDGASP